MEEKNKKNLSIDIVKLLNLAWNDRKMIGIYCGVAAVFSIIVAFSIPRIYKSTVVLAPESSGNSLTSNISSLASMVGMDMKFGADDDAIYPEIYPDLMQSTKFLVGLFDIPIVTKDKEIKTTYYDYIKNKQKIPWWQYPKNVVEDLIKKLKGKQEKVNGPLDPTMLSKEDYDITQSISSCIDCQVDKKTNVITITVTAQDPLVAKTVTDSVKSKLQEYITDYRTNKARHDLSYMEKLCKEAQADYDKARHNYAVYSDNYMSLVRESYKVKQEELENEMQLRYNIYTQIIQQLQISKAKVQERTPAFTEIQPAIVPIKHSNMPKVIILGAFIFLAVLVRLAILVWKNKNIVFTA